jgi:RNA polymerase sigma-70 factor (ECF subfamily)
VRRVEAEPGRVEERAVVAAAQAGDQAAFAGLVERHRPELQVHCYRMLGSWQESEDLVQETFLRAWRGRQSYQGRSTFRAWLYRIATNACLDFLARHPRRPLARQVTPEPSLAQAPPAAIPWLQPYPDRLLDQVAPSEAEPDAVVVAKETIELAFLAAIQHLPPRQRAVLLLRDVLGWSAKETAALLEVSVAAVKSALQRARPTLRNHLPPRRGEWAPSSAPTAEERVLLQRYMNAMEGADVAALAALLAEDARMTMPLLALWYEGRQAIVTLMAGVFDPGSPDYQGRLRVVLTGANRQPAAALYVRRPGDSEYRWLSLVVLRVEDGEVVEITGFVSDLFAAFGLPPTL